MRNVHPGSWIRIQGSKKHRFPDSGSATLVTGLHPVSHNRPRKVSHPEIISQSCLAVIWTVLIFDHKCFSGLKSPRLLPNRFYLPSQVLLEMLQLAHHALHNGCLVWLLSKPPFSAPMCFCIRPVMKSYRFFISGEFEYHHVNKNECRYPVPKHWSRPTC